MTSKQRANLRKQAHSLDAIVQVGKNGLSPEVTMSLDEALEARELVKVAVLNNCDEPVRDIANALSERTRSECVQVIGKKMVFYRPSKKTS
ncbi:MAG: ribosome assembly RNA-binding protein YhbY [Defluviitaleaceae bacterium]|nr:ribosome assembly RNA-binding protein YhbY [Defluviitaleaceae bacterium]